MAKQKKVTPEPVPVRLHFALFCRRRLLLHRTWQILCDPAMPPTRWGRGEYFGARWRAEQIVIALGIALKQGFPTDRKLPDMTWPDVQGYVYTVGDFEALVVEGEWEPSVPGAIADVLAASGVSVEVQGMVFWRFEQAPPLLAALSQHGGDEDWVVLIPPDFGELPFWMSEGTSFASSVDIYDLPEGWQLLISAH